MNYKNQEIPDLRWFLCEETQTIRLEKLVKAYSTPTDYDYIWVEIPIVKKCDAKKIEWSSKESC